MAIRIDNSEAKQKFDETKRKIEQVEVAMKKLEAEGKKNTAEWKALEKTHDELNATLYKQRLAAGRSALTIKELEQGLKQLRKAMRNVQPGTKEWYQYIEAIRLTTQRVKELRTTATATSVSVGKLSDGFSRYTGMVAGTIASLTGLTWGMQQCVDEYAKMDEAQSQTVKYTGMTREEVEQLNEQFKQMDTRTPRTELNRLAGEAGKLGITGVQDVMDFVDAANQINVALGEDLGDEAVNQIGKLSQMFGDESRSLKENMLAIGSAVNQVAQSTSASEPYLVEFTARMGGVGKQADMAVTDIMGFASALDQNMLRSEMASTALSGLIMRIYQEPAKFAEMARLDVQEFTELVSTDVNEAVLQFLESLNKMGGMANIAPILKEMKLSGAEAAGVISTLAGNVELVRREQENANKAFTEATSITNEYTVQNNTAQAQLDKARQSLNDVRVTLGEQLLPVMQGMISAGGTAVKGLSTIISFVVEYRREILTAVTAIATYTAVVKASTISIKSLGQAIKAAYIQIKLFVNALKVNPWGLLVAGITAAITAFVAFREKVVDVSDSIKEMNKELTSEQMRVNQLFTALKKSNEGSQQRRDIIKEINTQYGQYLPYLLDEKSNLEEIESAYKRVNDNIAKQIALKHKNQAASEVTESEGNVQVDSLDAVRRSVLDDTGSRALANAAVSDLQQITAEFYEAGMEWQKAYGQAYHSIKVKYYGSNSMSEFASEDMEAYIESYYRMQKKIAEINAKYADWETAGKPANMLDEVVVTARKKNKGGAGTTLSDDELKELETRLQQEYQARQNAAKQQLLLQMQNGAEEKATQDAYNAELYQAEMEYLLKRKDLLLSAGKDTSEIQGQIYDKMIAEANRLRELSSTETQGSLSLGLLDEEYAAEQQRIKQQYIDGDIRSEQEYREQLLELERDYLERRREMQAAYGMDTSATDGKLADMDVRQTTDNRRMQEESVLADIRSVDDLDVQNALLEEAYEQDLVSYEAYQEEKSRIAEEQEQRRQQIATTALQVVNQAASMGSQLVQALQNRELSQVENRYDKQIEAARKAGKDTTKLEEEKEEAMNAVRKKYADKEFAMQILQIGASTALAIMQCYAQAGPILGSIFAALVTAQAAIQTAVAKQKRDEAKGLYSGGYSDEYVEGYTPRGNPRDTAGVIPVHKNEFVANHDAVSNPAVRQFLDVFDMAQKKGTIRMLNTTQILEQIRTRSGRYSGGYTDDAGTTVPGTGNPLAGMSGEQRSQVVALLVENNRLLRILCDKELVVDARKVRDGIRHINRLESNVSR